MTDAQRSYLETLCRETGEEFDETLSKADASKRIDELRERSPRLRFKQFSRRSTVRLATAVALVSLIFASSNLIREFPAEHQPIWDEAHVARPGLTPAHVECYFSDIYQHETY
jgi:hypothetical protein